MLLLRLLLLMSAQARGALNLEMSATPLTVKLNDGFKLDVKALDASNKGLADVAVVMTPSPTGDADTYGFTCTGAASSMKTNSIGVLSLSPCRFTASPTATSGVRVTINAVGTSVDGLLKDTAQVTMTLDVSQDMFLCKKLKLGSGQLWHCRSAFARTCSAGWGKSAVTLHCCCPCKLHVVTELSATACVPCLPGPRMQVSYC
jgi:hypothetical protein